MLQVLETIDYSTVIFAVSARDLDSRAPYNEVSYTLVGENNAPTFFDVNPVNGEIRLRSSLLQDTNQQYRVSLCLYVFGVAEEGVGWEGLEGGQVWVCGSKCVSVSI